MPKWVVWQGDAYRPVTIGQRIGRLLPRPIGKAFLQLARRYAPGIYAEAIERAHNDGSPPGEGGSSQGSPDSPGGTHSERG